MNPGDEHMQDEVTPEETEETDSEETPETDEVAEENWETEKLYHGAKQRREQKRKEEFDELLESFGSTMSVITSDFAKKVAVAVTICVAGVLVTRRTPKRIRHDHYYHFKK
jgi:hypothetical protein